MLHTTSALEGQGDIVLLTGPHGSGKDTAEGILTSSSLGAVRFVRHTTRLPAQDEVEGHSYHFVTLDKFEELKTQDYFIDCMENPSCVSGVARDVLAQDVQNHPYVCMTMNVKEGLSLYKKLHAEKIGRRVLLFFVSPCPEEVMQRDPDRYLGILARRLIRRGRSGPGQQVVARLSIAEEYRRLYLDHKDEMIYIANEDNRRVQTLGGMVRALLGKH